MARMIRALLYYAMQDIFEDYSSNGANRFVPGPSLIHHLLCPG